MRDSTLRALLDISTRWPAENGKIIQMLLAISFDPLHGGFAVQNYLSQGVDVELTGGEERFALEVKSTLGTTVALQEKDLDALRVKYKNDNYIPSVAALRLHSSSDWVVADARAFGIKDIRLTPRDYALSRLALHPLLQLQEIVQREFPKTLQSLKDTVLSPPNGKPLEFLAHILERDMLASASAI